MGQSPCLPHSDVHSLSQNPRTTTGRQKLGKGTSEDSTPHPPPPVPNPRADLFEMQMSGAVSGDTGERGGGLRRASQAPLLPSLPSLPQALQRARPSFCRAGVLPVDSHGLVGGCGAGGARMGREGTADPCPLLVPNLSSSLRTHFPFFQVFVSPRCSLFPSIKGNRAA